MARIRTIKPDFFLDEGLADLNPLARILFVGLWTQADREGRLEDRPRRLKVALLPYDDADIDALLAQLARAGFIVRYRAEGQDLIWVPGFVQHQVPHYKELPSALPPPPSDVANAWRVVAQASADDDADSNQACGDVEPTSNQACSDVNSTLHAGREGKGREQERKGTRSRKRDLTMEAQVVRNEITLLSGVEYPPADFDALEARLAAKDMTGEDALALVRWAAKDKFWGGEVALAPSTLFRPKHWPGLLAKSKAQRLPFAAPADPNRTDYSQGWS